MTAPRASRGAVDPAGFGGADSSEGSPLRRRLSSVVLVLFGAAILLPQGVGFRLPRELPNLDLPRLAALALVFWFGLHALTTGRVRLNGAGRTISLLFLLAIWQFVSASQSESSAASLVWAAGNLITTWGFAIAFLALAAARRHRRQVSRALLIVGVILAVWSVFELVSQLKVFPVRNLWEDAEYRRFSTSLRRVIPGSTIILPFMSIGPYALNLPLAGALCALGGFLLVRADKSLRAHNLCVGFFVLAVLATQSRVGIVGLIVMVLLRLAWGGGRRERVLVGATLTLVLSLVIFTAGTDLRLAFDTALQGATGSVEQQGSFAHRLAGLRSLADQFGERWLFGFGPGSLVDADRVVTSVRAWSDPGSLFAIVIESGLPAAILLGVLLLTTLWNARGSHDPDVQAATLGLIGFLATSTSSLVPWVWPIALVLAGLIESWTKVPVPVESRLVSLPTLSGLGVENAPSSR